MSPLPGLSDLRAQARPPLLLRRKLRRLEKPTSLPHLRHVGPLRLLLRHLPLRVLLPGRVVAPDELVGRVRSLLPGSLVTGLRSRDGVFMRGGADPPGLLHPAHLGLRARAPDADPQRADVLRGIQPEEDHRAEGHAPTAGQVPVRAGQVLAPQPAPSAPRASAGGGRPRELALHQSLPPLIGVLE